MDDEQHSDGIELGIAGGRGIVFKGRITGVCITASAYVRREATPSKTLGKRLIALPEDVVAEKASSCVHHQTPRDAVSAANYGATADSSCSRAR